MLSSCAHRERAVPSELVGTWALTEESLRNFPPECRNLRLQFKSDGYLITTSAGLKLITKIKVVKQTGGFLVKNEIVDHNERQNCQGKSAHYIFTNFVFEMYFERNGELLRQYIWLKKSKRFVEFWRLKPAESEKYGLLRDRKRDAVDYLDKLLVKIFETLDVEMPTWRASSAIATP